MCVLGKYVNLCFLFSLQNADNRVIWETHSVNLAKVREKKSCSILVSLSIAMLRVGQQ